MRLALIQDDTVVNVIEAEPSFIPDPGLRALPSAAAGPGWMFDGSSFSPPPELPVAPKRVSMFQAREAMRRRVTGDGRSLLDAVNSYVEEQRSTQPTLALAWEYAAEVNRDGVFLEALAKVFGLDAATLDDLFRSAASIQV